MCNIYIYVNGQEATAVSPPPQVKTNPPPEPQQPQGAEIKPKPKSPLQGRFKALASMLDSDEQPSRFKIMRVVSPIVEALEQGEKIVDGLFDTLSPQARNSVMMLFLLHMLRDAEQLEKSPTRDDYPDKVPLDISEGDSITEEVVEGQVPYNQAPSGKLDPGF